MYFRESKSYHFFANKRWKYLYKSIFSLLTFTPCLLFAYGIEDAKNYHNNSEPQWNIAMETINLIPWSDSQNVLDVGCGDGKITACLAKKTVKGMVLGIDISQSMIDFASSHYPQIDYPNLVFQKQDATQMNFDNQFDLVVSFSTLHWVLEQEKALKAMYRALSPGGILCIQTYGYGNMNVSAIVDLLVHTKKWKSFFPSYTKQRILFTEQEYYSLLKEAGFQKIQVLGSWNKTSFANRQAIIDFVKPLLNFILHLSQDLQREFIEDVVDKIISMARTSFEGSIQYQFFILQATGIK